MQNTLVFGWRTALLAVAFVQLVGLAAALTRPLQNRSANRTLAALLIILAGMITPWMIGFAGFYDRWQWLSFAPLALPLAIAPLAYLYVHALAKGRWPERAWWHLIPAGIQLTYLSAAFVLLPQPFKNVWLGRSAIGYDLVIGVGVLAGAAAYWLACQSLLRDYRQWLSRQRSDDHRFALVWLGRAVAALFLLLTLWVGYGIYDLLWPLGYRGLMGLYAAIAAIALYLGIEGWRHAAVPFPAITAPEPPAPAGKDWTAQGRDWADRVRREGLHADPELSVVRLARMLGTNSGYVSRAFNEGLGQNFSAFINRLRCEDVAARLREGTTQDLLDLALDCGFSSKASFNRAFRAAFGCSPSAYRQLHGSNSEFRSR